MGLQRYGCDVRLWYEAGRRPILSPAQFTSPEIGRRAIPPAQTAPSMYSSLPLLVASVLSLSGDDTLKKKVLLPQVPARFRTEENAPAFSADSIVVEKARRTMTLYHQGAPVRIYFVALGPN